MTDGSRDPPPHLGGEFPFAAEAQESPATHFSIAEGPRIVCEFAGRAEVVRAIHRRHRFGFVAAGLDPDVALDIAAADPSVETTWRALGTALRALAEADCNAAETMDYLAVRKCGIDAAGWADATDSANFRTVTQNANRAARKLKETKDDDTNNGV